MSAKDLAPLQLFADRPPELFAASTIMHLALVMHFIRRLLEGGYIPLDLVT
jgi:hypothetical protein